MIVQPEAMDFSTQCFSMIIYGSPGVGKTIISEQEYRKLGCDERKRILYQGSAVKYT